ncbi:MAG: hypothetical protein NTX50_07440 [Candidatus Sumerlaeota bacterium]|nr:hypothetical protein [Candidatus Sumerlaeota bacterium]
MILHKKDGTTRFVFENNKASSVYLVGDFNGWDERATPMQRHGGEQWAVDLKLREGDYRFLYRVGAQWFLDWEMPNVPNPWGSDFSLLRIPAAHA